MLVTPLRSYAKFLLVLPVLFAACAPAADPAALPTLAQLPTLANGAGVAELGTAEAAVEGTDAQPTPSPTPELSATPTLTPSITPTPTNTNTPIPTRTPVPRPTIEATAAAAATITAQPVFSAPTAAPGATADTSQLVADVVITEAQFQEELDLLLQDSAEIQSATVDFRADGINILLTATGGEAMLTGNVLFGLTVARALDNPADSFITIQVLDIQTNAPEPPEAYIAAISGPLFEALLNALDDLLAARLGTESNLEDVVLTDDAMLITLLVPNP